HVAAIEVANLLLRTAGSRICGDRLDDLLQIAAGPLVQLREHSPARTVRRDGVGIEPMAVGVAKEVIARLHAGVVDGQVQAEVAVLGMRWGRPGRNAVREA